MLDDKGCEVCFNYETMIECAVRGKLFSVLKSMSEIHIHYKPLTDDCVTSLIVALKESNIQRCTIKVKIGTCSGILSLLSSLKHVMHIKQITFYGHVMDVCKFTQILILMNQTSIRKILLHHQQLWCMQSVNIISLFLMLNHSCKVCIGGTLGYLAAAQILIAFMKSSDTYLGIGKGRTLVHTKKCMEYLYRVRGSWKDILDIINAEEPNLINVFKYVADMMLIISACVWSGDANGIMALHDIGVDVFVAVHLCSKLHKSKVMCVGSRSLSILKNHIGYEEPETHPPQRKRKK